MGKDTLNSKEYADRLDMKLGVFHQAMSYTRRIREGRPIEGTLASPYVRRAAARIAPPTGLSGRVPHWTIRDVERFEAENPRAAAPVAAPGPRAGSLDRELEALASENPREVLDAATRAGLDERSLEVLGRRYGLPSEPSGTGQGRGQTQGTVARDLGLSRSRVSQLQREAEERTKESLKGGPGPAQAPA